ncbi:MAG: efflux RND transporter periplasmic adaptor subunit, partial [Proteobacteria bacterium]
MAQDQTNSDLSKLYIRRAPRLQNRRRWWPWLTALLLSGAGVAAAALSGKLERTVTVEAAMVTMAYPSQAMTELNATGYVVAQRKAAVASKATGRLEWLGVAEGSEVKAGQVIARLESRDVEASREHALANVAVAQANVELGYAELRDATRNLKRSRELIAKRFISEAAHDTAVTRYEKARASIHSLEASVAVARANVKAAQLAIDQTLIRAPFDGVVLTKHANVGDNITPFSNAIDTKGAVVTIADMRTLEVEADVSESSLAKIKVGQPVEVQLDAVGEQRFQGTVNRIVPTVDRAKATVLVKIGFVERDERVLPDMSAKVAFLERHISVDQTRPLTVVPAAAVFARDGDKYAYVVKDGRAQRV